MNAKERVKERVVTFLDREEIDFLDKIGKDALFSTGIKLSRTKLIAWLIDFAKSLNLNGESIRSEEDFELRVRERIETFANPAPMQSHKFSPPATADKTQSFATGQGNVTSSPKYSGAEVRNPNGFQRRKTDQKIKL